MSVCCEPRNGSQSPKSSSQCTIMASPSRQCFICAESFINYSVEERELHLNFCMDDNQKNQSSDIEFAELSDSDEDDFLQKSSDHHVWCQICGIDLSYLSTVQQHKHIDQCCKTQELLNAEHSKHEQIEDKGIVIYCSACGICLQGKSTEHKIAHFKKCHKKHKTSLTELKKIRNSKPVPELSSQESGAPKSRKKPRKKKKPASPIDLVSSGLPSAQADFLNVLNKAHYRPQPKIVPASPVLPSPQGEKDLAGFILTPRNTQVKKRIDTDKSLAMMFSEEDDSLDLSIDISPQSSSEASGPPLVQYRAAPRVWKLSTELARASQYKTSLLNEISPEGSESPNSQANDENFNEEEETPAIHSIVNSDDEKDPDDDIGPLSQEVRKQGAPQSIYEPDSQDLPPTPSDSPEHSSTCSPRLKSPLSLDISPENQEASGSMKELLSAALTSDSDDSDDSDDSLFGFPLNRTSSQIHETTITPPPSPNPISRSQTPPTPLARTPPAQTPRRIMCVRQEQLEPQTSPEIPQPQAQPQHFRMLQEVQEWYQEEIAACEKQKQEAIMEIETKFYAQIGRLAMQKEQKILQISATHNVPSTTLLISQIPMGSSTPVVRQIQSPRTRQPAQPVSRAVTASKRPLAQSDSSVSMPKRRRLNTESEQETEVDTEANEITRALNEEITFAIKSNLKLWTKMLLQETIDIREVKSFVSAQGLGCGLDYLASYLRAQGVPFRKPKRNRGASQV